jgi:hypothetical protein
MIVFSASLRIKGEQKKRGFNPRQERTGMEVEEVRFNYLRHFDRISIHTVNSVYEFSVTDPASQTGILKGGSLGETEIIASLLCCAVDEKSCDQSQKLSVGAKAQFLCASAKGFHRLITSPIQKLSYTRENQSEVNISVA